MYCKECGKRIPNDSKFCPECGTALDLDKQAGPDTDTKEVEQAGKQSPEKPQREKEQGDGKTDANAKKGCIGCLGFMLIVALIVIVIGSMVEQDDTHQSATVSSAQTVSEQSKGIGVGVAAIRDTFENEELGFAFQESSDVDGQPRLMATSPEGLATLELIGPADNLVSASMLIGIPTDSPETIMANYLYTLSLIKTVLPEWSSGADWLNAAFENVAEQESGQTVYEDKLVRFQAIPEAGMICFTIEGI